MSPLKLGKKLQPAKKAFKATIKRLIATFHHLIPSKGSKTSYMHAASNYHVHKKKDRSGIRIDGLFSEHVHDTNEAHVLEETSRSKDMVGMKDGGNLDTIEDAWNIVVGKTPQLHVDERAEEFITIHKVL